METHVLIPHPLILKVRPSANCSSPSVAKLLEQQVSVTTTLQIPKGWQIHPAQGTLRCGKLEVYSTLNHDNVSTTFSERSEVRNFKTIAEKMSKSSFFVIFILYHIAFQTTENETIHTNINMKVSFKRPDLEKIETEYFWQQLST